MCSFGTKTVILVTWGDFFGLYSGCLVRISRKETKKILQFGVRSCAIYPSVKFAKQSTILKSTRAVFAGVAFVEIWALVKSLHRAKTP